MRTRNDISLSVLISMLGGLFIIVGSLALLGLSIWQGSTLMMGGRWHLFALIYPSWLTSIMIAVSISAGGLVIISAYKMHKKSEDKLKWGFLVMIGSIVGLFSVGPFGLGGVLGIIGGISALNRRQ